MYRRIPLHLLLMISLSILVLLIAQCSPTSTIVTYDITPEWSPDGRMIVFVCYVPTTQEALSGSKDGELRYPPQSSEICTMASDGTIRRQLTQNRVSDFDPTWSPDGTQIAFISNRTGSYSLYLMSASGDLQQKVSHSGYVGHPIWSPDGSQIAYFDEDDSGIYILDLHSGQERLLIKEAYNSPTWSPDGKMLAFITQLDDKQSCEVRAVWVDSGIEIMQPRDARCRAPAWSSDGTHLLYVSSETNAGLNTLSALDIRLVTTFVLAQEKETINDIHWSPTNNLVFYLVGQDALHVAKFDGSGSSYITNLEGLITLYRQHSIAVSPGGTQIIFPRGNTTDVASDPIRIWRINSDGSGLTQISP